LQLLQDRPRKYQRKRRKTKGGIESLRVENLIKAKMLERQRLENESRKFRMKLDAKITIHAIDPFAMHSKFITHVKRVLVHLKYKLDIDEIEKAIKNEFPKCEIIPVRLFSLELKRNRFVDTFYISFNEMLELNVVKAKIFKVFLEMIE